MDSGYQLVRVGSGEFSLRSLAHQETFHPVVGPVAEAQALYVKQMRLPERIATTAEPFVIWDIGLGAAANPLTLLHALLSPAEVRIASFDCTAAPLEFALANAESLPYLRSFEDHLRNLQRDGSTQLTTESGVKVHWEFHLADFPDFLTSPLAATLEKPHAIFYDAFSPAKNPAMWTLPVFRRVFELLDPNRPCAMPTYSRSTLLRVTLLLAGFFVGAGHATGEKEETTIAANSLALLEEPLGREWLFRARKSTSAEPLHTPAYIQKPLSEETWERLRAHPQFA